jgi:post-segregation antitoxin (ccd killing protein)
MSKDNSNQTSGTETALPAHPQSKPSAEEWLTENRAAILAYNASIIENGLPLERFRQF